MILGIDTGNSHTVLGCIDEQGTVVQVFRMETNRRRTEYEYASDISRILEIGHIDIHSFEGAIISSVVPPMIDILKGAVKLMTGLDALVLGAGIKTGLDIGLDDPGTIAADLVAAAVAAKELYPLPCVIIDMGTATTFSVLNEKGRFLGGAIMPGVAISLNALTEDTSLLPRIEILPPKKAIGTNTIDCMKSGLVLGAVGSIDCIVSKMEEEIGPMASVVATGGLASSITPYCSHEIINDDNLLLSGLAILWKKNKDAKKKSSKSSTKNTKKKPTK